MAAEEDFSSLFLVGFMGVGKSTVGSLLAQMTGAELIDLDTLIAHRAGMSIPEIFDCCGEAEFRRQETAALASLPAMPGRIVATGGGVVGREENWTLMRRAGVVVYLRADWHTLEERIGSGEGRPLAAGAERARLRSLWEQRLPLYERAEVIVDAEAGSPEAVARRVLEAINRQKGQG